MEVEPLRKFAIDTLHVINKVQPRDDNHALVIIGQRLGLDIAFGQCVADEFLKTALASHLGVHVNTTEDRLWTSTCYPSEPFLSCVAAHEMHAPSNLECIMKAKSGLLDMSFSCGLASRLLWLLAKDFYVREKHPEFLVQNGGSEWDAELSDCMMIPVIDFFKFLFGVKFWESAGLEAEKDFENAYVNFSHWVLMGKCIRTGKGNEIE